MFYFGSQSHGYVPPSISGTEKVKMSTMKVTNMTETEQRIKMRHAFAMSSLVKRNFNNFLLCKAREFFLGKCLIWVTGHFQALPRMIIHFNRL